jgi:hypothetical protein
MEDVWLMGLETICKIFSAYIFRDWDVMLVVFGLW